MTEQDGMWQELNQEVVVSLLRVVWGFAVGSSFVTWEERGSLDLLGALGALVGVGSCELRGTDAEGDASV